MEDERTTTRRNFKVKLPDELMELVMLLEGVMQRKEMYEDMRQHMLALFAAHQGDEQTLLKSFCIERGKRDLLVYLTEQQLGPLDVFSEAHEVALKDLVYNMVLLYLTRLRADLTAHDLKLVQELPQLRARVAASYDALRERPASLP